MPVLAKLFQSLFGGLVGFFSQWLTKRVAIGTAAVAVFSAVTASMYGVMSAALQGLAVSLPAHEGVSLAFWVAAPGNLPTAVSAVFGADAAVALYAWNVKLLRLVSAP